MDAQRHRRSWLPAAVAWAFFAAVVVAAGWSVLRACGLGFGNSVLVQFCTPIDHEPAERVRAELTVEQTESRRLQRRIADLERAVAGIPACPAPPPAPEPPENTAAGPEPERELQPEPEPEQRAASEPEPAPEAEPERPARPDPNQVTRLQAPPTCPVETPAELLMVIDTSGSMRYPYNADPAKEQRMADLAREMQALQANNVVGALIAMARFGQLQAELQRLDQEMRRGPGPDRMSVAKRAADAIVDAMPPVVDMRLVTFGECGRYGHTGPFSAAQRPTLKQRIGAISPQAGTPLANTIDALPRLSANGRTGDKPVNVVIISDGVDSCDGDPCAAARRLKQQMPFAVVSVVAASRTIGSLRCVADNTKGLFLEAASAADLDVAVRQASGRDLPAHCR